MTTVAEPTRSLSRPQTTLTPAESGFATTPLPHTHVPIKRARSAGHRARSSETPTLTEIRQPRLAPPRVDLVEHFSTGTYYLRAFVDGHFLWQPVAGDVDAIPDSGAWVTGRDFHDTYWFNHGPYRRRAGIYHPVQQEAAA